MFKKMLGILAGVGVLAVLAGATDVSGPVSGTWTAAGNPYYVIGEINVPAGQTLVIQPGVQVIFQGYFKFIVDTNATLKALGTQQDTVLFTAVNPAIGWHGIRFIVSSDSSRLEYCHLTRGRATGSEYDNHGGAIYATNTKLVLSHCLIDSNHSTYIGGGVSVKFSVATIEHCKFAGNVCTGSEGGGGIFSAVSHSVISNNVFVGNSAGNKGGGIYFESDTSLVENNLFEGNSAYSGGGITAGSNSSLQIRNNTFHNNSGNPGYVGGIQWGNGFTDIRNCILWGNTPAQLSGFSNVYYCDIQDGYIGTGNINTNPLFVTGPGGNYYLSQLAAGQTQQSPCVDAGDPASPMIEGTTRTDQIQDIGIVDMGYHYLPALPPPPPPPVIITLTPFNPPITIPAQGGTFSYLIMANNTQPQLTPCQAWIDVTLPNGHHYGPVWGPMNLTLPGSIFLGRTRSQSIPGWAPAGTYSYNAYIGPTSDSVWDSDSFPFTKLATGDGPIVGNWFCSGDPFPGEVEGQLAAPMPGDYSLSAFPNPFNPSTVISYELPAASHVSLRIYDTTGRLISTLADGWTQAGTHHAAFDGTGLASGIYLYTLTAGQHTAAGKMVQLK